METFQRILFVAVLAGLLSGVFVTVAHQIATVPVILKAETYEAAGENATASVETAHEPGSSTWAPADGLGRMLFTLLADVLTGMGYALLLVAGFALRGGVMNWRKGLYWGLAGFATFTLAPALGLPPDVPGTAAAPLLDRQLWWLGTALATGGGLALLFLSRRATGVVAGMALILMPHLLGAPQPVEYMSLAPESLGHRFMTAVVVTSLLFWLTLGGVAGFLYGRLGSRAAALSAAKG